MQEKHEISPTLTQIVNQFNEDNRRPLDTFSSQYQSGDHIEQDDTAHDVEPDIDADTFETRGAWNFDQEDHGSFAEDDSNGMDTSFPNYDEVYALNYLLIMHLFAYSTIEEFPEEFFLSF